MKNIQNILMVGAGLAVSALLFQNCGGAQFSAANQSDLGLVGNPDAIVDLSSQLGSVNLGGSAGGVATEVPTSEAPTSLARTSSIPICEGRPISDSGCGGATSIGPQGDIVDNSLQRTYKITEINGQCWMAENIAEVPSLIPSNVPFVKFENNGWYGEAADGAMIYQYSAARNSMSCTGAMQKSSSEFVHDTVGVCNAERVRGVCPAGWHIPSDCEVMDLEVHLGMPEAKVAGMMNREGHTRVIENGQATYAPGGDDLVARAMILGDLGISATSVRLYDSRQDYVHAVGRKTSGFWTSTLTKPQSGLFNYRLLKTDISTPLSANLQRVSGRYEALPVRCIKD